MFILTTYNTTLFVFEGSVEGKEGESYIVKMMMILGHDTHILKIRLQPTVRVVSESGTQSLSMVLVTLHHFTLPCTDYPKLNYHHLLVPVASTISLSLVYVTVSLKMYRVTPSDI